MEHAKKAAISLNHKVIIALFIVILFYALLDSYFHHRLITPTFTALEDREVETNLTRCLSFLDLELRRLDRQNYAWSYWNDTYDFVSMADPGAVHWDWAGAYLNNTELDLLYFHNSQGKLVWGESRDSDGGRVVGPPPEVLSALEYFFSSENNCRVMNGILATRSYPIMLSIRPIINPNGSGNSRGAVTLGRYLDEIVLATISNYTLTNISLTQLGEPERLNNYREVLAQLSAGDRFVFDKTYDIISLYTLYPDVYGKRQFLLSVANKREIFARAKEVERKGLHSVMIIGLIILATTFILLTVIVISPLNRLTRYIRRLQADDYKAPVSVKDVYTDEIGVLTYEFNNLVNQLDKSRKKLLVQSYYAGIGESSSVILHNIRNTLSPIVVNVDLLGLNLKEISMDHLRKAMEEYTDPSTDHERRQAVEEYLLLAVERIADIFEVIRKRLDRMIIQSGRIESILASQKKFSHIKPPLEQVELVEIVKDSIERIADDDHRNVTINIDHQLSDCGMIEIERIYLMQIIEHLVTNSLEAIAASDTAEGRIDISCHISPESPHGLIVVKIKDNGVGVEDDHLQGVFQREYTTKEEAVAGIGLHWCATTIHSMGGEIAIESAGKGKGATVSLKLPRFRNKE